MAACEAAAAPHAENFNVKQRALELFPDLDDDPAYALEDKWWETPNDQLDLTH